MAMARLTAGRIVLILIAGLVTVVLALGWVVSRKGYSARRPPLAVEEAIARRLRYLATPPSASETRNPIAASPDVVRAGMAHFADHCAPCHAHEGSGRTPMGEGMYPPPPDLRGRRTQELSDGEIFYVIRNGIRFTGMPGWATGPEEDDVASWHLVHFIRHLPRLTPEELAEMGRVNPRGRSTEEIARARRQAEDAFLAGEDVRSQPDAGAAAHSH